MNLTFHNGKFRILQVSDAQDLQFVRKTMLRMLDNAYDRVAPDLVVLTGDNILGNHLRDARLLTPLLVRTKDAEYKALKKAVQSLLDPIAARNLPFAAIFGNHDDRNEHTKAEQAAIFRAYPQNIGLNGAVEEGTFDIPIFGKDGKIRFVLWMMDSAWYDHAEKKCFEEVKPAAVEWLKAKAEEYKKQNGGKAVPSILFQHIPLPETRALLEKCPPFDPGAVAENGDYYRLKPECSGEIKEPVSVCEGNGLFEALTSAGGVKAVVFGHDHLNEFEGVLDGIRVLQTPCASFRCYGDRKRGVRVFEIDEKTGDFETYMLHYDDLCGKNFRSEFHYLWDADDMAKKKAALLTGAGAAAAAAGMAALRCRMTGSGKQK